MSRERPWIVANIITGKRVEPFFQSSLASIENAVDFVVLNDNSGEENHPNLASFRDSHWGNVERGFTISSDFLKLSGFDEARNLCLHETGRMFPGKNVWILYLDADEVHTPELEKLTRGFLPTLSESVGAVDGYFYQFLQSLEFYYSLDRRHNMLFRYHPQLLWERPVHETLAGIRGKRIPTGYVYFHYGYLFQPEEVLNRWRQYKRFDGLPFDPDRFEADHLFDDYEKERTFVPFHRSHPRALDLFFAGNPRTDHLQKFTRTVRDYRARHPMKRWRGRIMEMNWRLRLAYRDLRAGWRR